MRNKKGFTLVELLAALVILGLLVVFAFPAITRMVFRSREKIYVSDAQKLIAHAEYKLRANNSEIQKPDPGDCIVISLLYLDNQDFDNAPNDGAYQREKSFVVVKNVGGDLQYSVMLVEKKKDGYYRGIPLVTSDKLYGSGTTRLVANFEEEDLIQVDSITDIYINNYLGGNYIEDDGEVSAIYNISAVADDSYVDESSPRIMSAQLLSSSNKPFPTLDATLNLKVEDGDTPLRNLTVYYSTAGFLETTGEPYGEEYTSFYHDFHFDDEGFTLGSKVTLYIVVKDPEGNKDRKKIVYDIPANAPPAINDDSGLVKRPGDSVALLTGLLTLNVEDDYDAIGDLQVCFAESMNSDPVNQCDSYQPYTVLFDGNNRMDYTFTQCEGGCKRDGLPHYLTVFVKDTMGLAGKKTFTYNTSTNEAPTFTENVSVTTKPGITTGFRDVVVSVRARDDVDPLSRMTVTISDGADDRTYQMLDSINDNNFNFTLSGNYDGSNKSIVVTVTDSEGKSTSQTANYHIYKDTAPNITNFSIESVGIACDSEVFCPVEVGGSFTGSVLATIEDDLDSNDDIRVCVSENVADCIVNDQITGGSHYVPYSTYINEAFEVNVNASSYDGSNHVFHLYAVDSAGNISHAEATYTIYKNSPPLIQSVHLVSVPDEYVAEGSLHAALDIVVEDDFDTEDSLRVSFKEDNNTLIDKQSLAPYIYGDNNTEYLDLAKTHTIADYDGSTHSIDVIITDSNGESVNQVVEYTIYKDSIPRIESFYIESRSPACANPEVCPVGRSGNLEAKYFLSVYDDFGAEGVSYCVSETSSCNSFIPFVPEATDVHGYPLLSDNYNFTGSNMERKLHVFIKDSTHPDDIVESVANYTIYETRPPVIFSIENEDNPKITKYYDENGAVLPVLMYEIYAAADDDSPGSTDDDLKIKYCYKVNGTGTEKCTSSMKYVNRYFLNKTNFFDEENVNGKTFSIYCKLTDVSGRTTKSNAIDFTPYEESDPVIKSVDAIPSTGKKIDVTFLVVDPLDTYQVCISKSKTCTDYLDDVYSGSDREYHTISFTNSDTNTSGVTLNIFVKDSSGNIAKDHVVSGPYTECSAYYYNKSKVEYTFKSGMTYDVTNGEGIVETIENQPITMNRCQGRCYLYNPVADDGTQKIKGYYDKKTTYFDRFDSSKLCPSSAVTDNKYEANCSYKDCFLKNDNYNRHNVIGAFIYPTSTWTYQYDGVTYTSKSYYKLFESSYTSGDAEITLSETTTKICPQLVNNGVYNYNADDSDPYLRVVEHITDPDFIGGTN